MAFGSLIIAICRMIRVFLEYLDRKLKKYDNPFTRAIMCCLKCFFWCLEKFLKFINKNAYIMCAVHGKNFCSSARRAFGLLMRNIVRVFVLDKVKFLLLNNLITFSIEGKFSFFLYATVVADTFTKMSLICHLPILLRMQIVEKVLSLTIIVLETKQ